MRFWMSWWGGEDDDPRPVDDAGAPVWACSGFRESPEPCHSICAVVDAPAIEEAWAWVRAYWPEVQVRFCEHKPDDWVPAGGRFACIVEKLVANALTEGEDPKP